MIADDIAKQAAIKEAIGKRDAALGQNGPQRVDALNKSFLAAATHFFPDKAAAVAQQMSAMLVTPDNIAFLEKIMGERASQGVTSFNGAGRGDGAQQGAIAGYATMTFEQKSEAISAANAAKTARTA